MKVVVLAGGTGVRLWPLSRQFLPKQFLKLEGQRSFLQKTVERFLLKVPASNIFIVINEDCHYLALRQLLEVSNELNGQIIIEPGKRNTGPALLFALKYLQEKGLLEKDEPLLVSPSDYWIEREEEFLDCLNQAKDISSLEKIVTFGIKPLRPETGFGYLEVQSLPGKSYLKVERFIEKPSYEIAQRFVESEKYLWNSGLFLFTPALFGEELKQHASFIFDYTQSTLSHLKDEFLSLPDISIDYLLMEKTKNLIALSLDCGWADLGSWDAFFEVLNKDEDKNVKIGNVYTLETKDSLIISEKRLVATVGLEDILVIDTEDALYIGKKGESQKVKKLVEQLKVDGNKEIQYPMTVSRPWGSYKVIHKGLYHQVKHITVYPLQKLSVQMHFHRSEYWVIVRGVARITFGQDSKLLYENQSVYIPKTSIHCIENPGKVPLEFIEVQMGEYLEEDDIVRLESRYGRNLSEISSKDEALMARTAGFAVSTDAGLFNKEQCIDRIY